MRPEYGAHKVRAVLDLCPEGEIDGPVAHAGSVASGAVTRARLDATRLPGMVLLLILLSMGLGYGQARGASLPPIPADDQAVQSRCSSVSISPEVLEIGDTLTGTASPATDQCGGPPSSVHWSWDFAFVNPFSGEKFTLPGLKALPGCSMSECRAKAVAPSGGWSDAGIDGSSPFGEWTSDEPYIVLDHQYEVSGTITQKGSSVGVGGVRVRASCHDGGTTTTDAGGHYNFLLGFGSCAIAPVTTAGTSSQPAQRTVHVTTHPITKVDFQVGCDAGGQAADRGRAAAAGGGDPCALDVKVDVLENPIRSGLAVHREPYTFFPVDFREPKNSTTYMCDSGCGDVVITVSDQQTHKPVADAKVDVHALGLDHVVSGEQFICATNDANLDTGGCGKDFLANLVTDNAGQVRVTYWAPGVGLPAQTTLQVTAKESCSQSACPTREKFGQRKTKLRVVPYLIYRSTTTLSKEQVEELANWGASKNLFTPVVSGTTATIGTALGVLEGAEVAAETAVKGLELLERVEPVIIATDLLHFSFEAAERFGFIAFVMDGLDLSPYGLGYPPFEAEADGDLSKTFADHMANLGTAAPLKIGAAGIVWDYAKTLATLAEHHDPAFEHSSITLKVFEVSHCDPTLGACDPGYGSDVGSADPIRAGVEPELYFDFTFNYGQHTPRFGLFTIPYDAIAWSETQAKFGKLLGVLP